MAPPAAEARAIAGRFRIYGQCVAAEPYGTGHINDTYCAVFDQGGTRVRYIIQRINGKVFRDPAAVMDNIERVTAHIGKKLAGVPDFSRRVLTLIPARDGRSYVRDEGGCFWRGYIFIENARTYDVVESERQAFEAARAFGRFQEMLADLPPPRLRETIAGFHDTPKRFEALERAIAADPLDRAALAGPEIEFALRRRPVTRALVDAGLPERVTHNDTKLNNVMIDDATGEGVCAIDLDTVMPGLALYDFGDMVRATTSPAMEDERDLSKVAMRFPMFEALVRGYLEAAGRFLTAGEKAALAVAGKVITLENGMRFLTDFLAGDTYFKVHRPGHNLDRCRTQFRLVESIEGQEGRMAELVARL